MPTRVHKEGVMNRRNRFCRSGMRRLRQARVCRMLAASALALCVVALAFPVATACAWGTDLEVDQQSGDGYGTAWIVDPGEWYVATAAPAVQVNKAQYNKAQFEDDGYLSAWFIDPGEWYVVPEISAAQSSGD